MWIWTTLDWVRTGSFHVKVVVVAVSALFDRPTCSEVLPTSNGRRELDMTNWKEVSHGGLKDEQFLDRQCPLEVVLPPEKSVAGCEGYLHTDPETDKDPYRGAGTGKAVQGKKRISLHDMECDVSLEEDNRQEWMFTLYDFDNSGKVTKEDMSSLMHTIYEVVDASVNQSSCHSKSKTLRVKLIVTPEPSPRRKDNSVATPDRESREHCYPEESRAAERRLSSHIKPGSPGPGCSDTAAAEEQHYCVDENTERRNHYLDLAGIENYTSKFEGSPPAPPSQETHGRSSQTQNRSRSQEAHAATAHQRRSQVIGENYSPLEAQGRGPPPPLRSPKGASKGGGWFTGSNEKTKSSKCHAGYYPPYPPLQTMLHTGSPISAGHGGQDVYHLPHQAQPSSGHHQHPLQHSHSRRLRAKARENQALSASRGPQSPHSHGQHQAAPPPPAPDREKERDLGSSPAGSPGSFVVPLVQRHEHSHHHEHHHHHHYHHYHQT
ncbi:hypothetical protein UPYG_G00157270 [Umbra pygmaea]|uniref:Protein naked cuticle homolog n=1 Tax=Umbra pygmaea TaxID=75934 RepID=A0ABD0XJ25_UMBPY